MSPLRFPVQCVFAERRPQKEGRNYELGFLANGVTGKLNFCWWKGSISTLISMSMPHHVSGTNERAVWSFLCICSGWQSWNPRVWNCQIRHGSTAPVRRSRQGSGRQNLFSWRGVHLGRYYVLSMVWPDDHRLSSQIRHQGYIHTCYAIPFSSLFDLEVLDMFLSQANEFLNISQYKNAVAWAERIKARPAVVRGMQVNSWTSSNPKPWLEQK